MSGWGWATVACGGFWIAVGGLLIHSPGTVMVGGALCCGAVLVGLVG